MSRLALFTGLRQRLQYQLRRVMDGPAGQWYRGLSTRDRNAVHLLSAFAVLLLLWQGIWNPLHDFADRAALRYQAEAQALSWMEANRNRVEAAGAAPAAAGSLLTIASTAARRLEITLNRFQPEGERGISVTLEDVAFDRLVQWLDVLQREHGVRAAQLNVERAEENGRVNARLLLRGA